MKITGISADSVEGGQVVTIKMFVPGNEELQGGDISLAVDLVKGYQDRQGGASAAVESPTTRRRRGGSEPTAEATQSTTAAESPTPRRRRGASAADAAPVSQPIPSLSTDAGAASEPRRRRRGSTEPQVPAGISDEDLLKACTAAAEYITPAVVKQIMEEDHKVTDVKKIPQDEREAFLGALDDEVEAAKEDAGK